MALTVRHLRGQDALVQVGSELDHLFESTHLPFTARRPWLQSFIDTHPLWDPWLIMVESGAEAVAAAPLAVRRRAGLTEVAMVGHGPTDDARLPARTPEAAQALAVAIRGGLPRGPWRMRLQQLPAEDPVVSALVPLLPCARVQAGQGMPLVEITGTDPNAHLSKNTRKALAKIRNRVAERGLEPELHWTRDEAEIVGLLPEFMRVHRERDLSLGRRPDHEDPAAAAFYREVITRHAERGEVEVLTLRLDGELAAYVCGFRDGRAFRSWDNRLSPRWADLSAGRIANSEAIRHVVTSSDYDALDWMRGEEPYKLQSATRVVPTAELHAWSSAALARLDDAVVMGTARARDLVRENEALRAALTRVRRLRHGGG
jgi:CelD/BcsL family acetyltransferase involved in cellulose biosynthesis